jgi:hypothetical protein
VNGLLSGWRGWRVMRPAHTGLSIVDSEGDGVSEVLINRHASALPLPLRLQRSWRALGGVREKGKSD